MAVKGTKNKRMTKAEKEAKEARKAVVCNEPGTNPGMFYYTERCILKDTAHTYKRTNRRAAAFQKRAIKEHETISMFIKTLKIDVKQLKLFLSNSNTTIFRSIMMKNMVSPENMKKNTSPLRRYERLFKDMNPKMVNYIETGGFEAEAMKIVFTDVHIYFYSVAKSIHDFSDVDGIE